MDVDEKKYSLKNLIQWVIAFSITTLEGLIRFTVNKFNTWPQYLYWIVGSFFIVFGVILIVKLKNRKPFNEYRKPLLLISVATALFCSIPIISYWFMPNAIQKIRNEFANKRNKNKIKVLVLPFVGGSSGSSVEYGRWVEQIIEDNIEKDRLTDKVLIYYYDQTDAVAGDSLKFNIYGTEPYMSYILNDMHADLLIFAERLPDGSVSYSWKSSNLIQKYLDSATSNRGLNAHATDPTTIEEIKQGRLTGCIDLIISFTSLQLDFLSGSYKSTIKRYSDICYNKIKLDSTCPKCFIYKMAHFIAAESSLKIWNNKNAERIMRALNLLEPDINNQHCNFSNEDSIRTYIINSWIRYANDENQEGLDMARHAVLLFDSNSILDTIQYLNANLLIATGLINLGHVKESILFSKSLIMKCKSYPKLSAINYCNLGGLYGRYISEGHIDSSFLYLKLAEGKNKIDEDSSILIDIISNYQYVYDLLTSNAYFSKREVDSMKKLPQYRHDSTENSRKNDYYNDLKNSIHYTELEKSEYFILTSRENTANVFLNKAYYFIQLNPNQDSVNHYSSEAIKILLSISDNIIEIQPNSSLLVSTYIDICTYYSIVDVNYDKSLYFALKALGIFNNHKIDNYILQSSVYRVLASDYRQLKKKDLSLKFCNKGIEFCKNYPDDIEMIEAEKNLNRIASNASKLP